MGAASARERVELDLAACGRFLPFAGDPTLLFEFMEGRVEGAMADMKRLVGHLAEAGGDGPAGHRFEAEDLEDEDVESALENSVGFAHGLFTGIRHVSNTDT